MTNWKDVEDGTKLRLTADLYSMAEFHSDLYYQLLTKEEVDNIVTISYHAGDEFELNLEDEILYGVGDNGGELGIDINGTIEPTYEIVK